LHEDGYLGGPPELIVEVAASFASTDLRDKRRAYCRNAAREYLVWLVAEARLEWFCLEDDAYRPQLPDAQGVLHSRVFPGLRLPVAPMLAGDTAKFLAALAQNEMPMGKQSENSVVNEDPFTTGK
jgi:Uma2 family endonuclease